MKINESEFILKFKEISGYCNIDISSENMNLLVNNLSSELSNCADLASLDTLEQKINFSNRMMSSIELILKTFNNSSFQINNSLEASRVESSEYDLNSFDLDTSAQQLKNKVFISENTNIVSVKLEFTSSGYNIVVNVA